MEARFGGNELKLTRAWKFFLLLPRILLFRPPRGGKIPKPQLLERFAKFQRGQWSELVEEGAILVKEAHSACCRKRRRQKADVPRRAHRGFPETVENPQSVDESVEAPERAKEPSARLGQDPCAKKEPVVLDGEEFVKSFPDVGQLQGPSGMCAKTLEASP